MKLDLIDRKILYFLDQNARQSIAQLSKKLRINRNVALYRINKLKEEKIIRGALLEINSPALGYLTFRIFLKLGNATGEAKKKLISFITENRKVTFFSQVLGKWDLDLLFMGKNLSEFETFRKELFQKFNGIIQDVDISLLTSIHYYPKTYLIEEKSMNRNPTVLDIEKKGDFKHDRKDGEILLELSKDPFINLVDLTGKVKMSINTLKKKIRNLEEKNIILGYRLFIDPTKIGYEYYKLHINLKDYKEKDVEGLRNWLGSKNFTIYIDHYINGADFEVELIFRGEKEYISFLEDLEKVHGKIISNKYLLKFFDNKKFRYLPE